MKVKFYLYVKDYLNLKSHTQIVGGNKNKMTYSPYLTFVLNFMCYECLMW